MPIAVGGILHETNTFAHGLTELAAFETPGAFPGLLQGGEVLTTLRGSRMCLGGYIAEAERLNMQLVPFKPRGGPNILSSTNESGLVS